MNSNQAGIGSFMDIRVPVFSSYTQPIRYCSVERFSLFAFAVLQDIQQLWPSIICEKYKISTLAL